MKRIAVVVAALWCLAPVLAEAQMYVYPAKGQSPEQQQRDQGECHTWAVQQTGFNPGMAAPVQTGPDGSMVRGAAGGALVGAAIGGIAGDAGKGAAGGAVGGALLGGMRRRGQQQSQANANAAGQQAYQRAYSACMQGRGYTVN